MKLITSRANPVFKALVRLKDSARERRTERTALLDGAHLLESYLDRVGLPRALAIAASAADKAEIKSLAARAVPVEPVVLADGLFRELAPVTTPSGILAVVDIPATRPVPPTVECCVLLERIQDPGNLGSILRSTAAAGVRDVLLSKDCADAWAPRVLRAAMGAHFSLNIEERADLVAFARQYAGQVAAAALGANKTVFETDLTRPTAFAIGSEGSGLSRALLNEADAVVTIPMPGGLESINAAAAAAVCLFERVRQLRCRTPPQ